MSKVVLVTGATGKQGGAVVDALTSSPQASEFTILAVTRNPSSGSAQKLAQKPQVKLVQGDLNDVEEIFKNAKEVEPRPVWGVFSVQVPMGKGASPENEEQQGKALIDESLKQGVKFFVYTSVDRGGDKSSDNPTPIPHFISKHNIEHHLQDKAGDKMDWCVLRPTAFFDNMTPGMQTKMFATAWKVAVKDKPLQFIAVSDIGHFAAKAFIEPEKYNHRFISLAGDDLSFYDANKIFEEKTGSPFPLTFEFVASGFLWAVKEMGIMMKWFYDEGYGANISELKKEHPGLLDFAGWLEKKSAFQMKQ